MRRIAVGAVLSPLAALAIAVALAAPSGAHAQQLAAKRTLSTARLSGCPTFPAPTLPGARETAEARRLTATAQEAAIVGDHKAARDAFAQAAQLNPRDERIAYQLARAHEELREVNEAARQYCRFLSLAPDATESADVRARIAALTQSTAITVSEQVRGEFRTGVALFDQKRMEPAIDAFSRVARQLPTAPEPFYNRALAYAALGQRRQAIDDFERYLRLRPTAEDEAFVRLQVAQLQRPVWNPGAALVQGAIFPGLGQWYTSRPIPGLLVLGAVGGSAYWALKTKTVTKTGTFTDPFGTVRTYEYTDKERPNFSVGSASAVTIMLGAALEAAYYARRSRESVAGGPRAGLAGSSRMELFAAPSLSGESAVGLRIPLRF